MLSLPASQSATAQDAPLRLTAKQLDKLSQRYTPRTDGTPGLVAAAAAASDSTSGTAGDATSGATGGSGSDATPAAGDSSSITQKGSWETARGSAATLALNGTADWVALGTSGVITRYNAKGDPVWTRTSHSLYTDWQVKPKVSYQPDEYTPVMYEGYDPYEPSAVGTHPYAQADFNHDGVADLAVAYSVGASPSRSFTSPGSDLQYGTFVSLLDGRTGRMIWHKLVPGYVGSLLAQDGKLVVADSTGPDWGNDPVADQGSSRSSLLAYSFTPSSGGSLTGSSAWTYSTGAPWADWTDLESMTGGRITVGWTDTPMGLGSPRPADGHVLVLNDGTGKATVDVKTPGYPRILHQEPGSNRVLVAEQNDPLDAVRWDLTSIDAASGTRSVIASRNDTIPEAFLVNATTSAGQARYAVAELGIDPTDLTDGQSTISGWNASGKTLWSHRTASTVGGYNAPTLSVQTDPLGHGQVVAAVADPVVNSPGTPEGIYHSQLIDLDSRDGSTVWKREGDIVADQVTNYQGRLLTVGYDLNAHSVNPQTGTTTELPMLSEQYAAVATDVNGDGVQDLITGGQSHGVFALDGRTLKNATPTVLWHSPVSAAVHALTLAQVADDRGDTAQRLVASTSHGFAVLDPKSGQVTDDTDTGTFQYGVTVHGGRIIASGTQALSAYTANGTAEWNYRPAGTDGKKVVYSTVADDGSGRLYLEYGGFRSALGTGASDPAPTAVALDAATGAQQWSEQPSGADATWIEQQSGAFASAAIPGADGHGVAFAWGGDQPSTLKHQVQIVDGRTGKELSASDSIGAGTFQGFAASAKYGLVELHAFDMTVHPADGSAAYEVHTLPNVQQAVFATTTGGNETFAAGVGGLLQYNQPFPHSSDYVSDNDELLSLFAGSVTPVSLGGGTGTDLIGLPRDWAAYDLSQRTGGYGADMAATDNYPHGITAQRLGDPAATASARTQSAQTTAAEAAPIRMHSLPSGIAGTNLKIKATHAVAADDTTETTTGYTPQQIQARLGLTGDGTGQTLAIVDAYDYPNAKSDLNHFSSHFGLPQTCDSVASGTDCFDFQQVYAEGTAPAENVNWEEEEALDIEWAHSVAPHAKIVLVEAADASSAGLYRAVDKADSLHPAAVSNSWGMSEFSEESFYDAHCKLADSVCTQSTGDYGYPAGYSSTNPYTLAIGGTHLVLDSAGGTQSESAWSSTGGGLSYFEKRPAYQDGVQSSAYRATPDVSFDADPQTGVPVYLTATGSPLWLEVGGTSLSAPVWGALLTDADQLRAAGGKQHLAVAGPDGDTAHTDVYALGGKLNDVTSGSNGACGTECTAGVGYDTVTGLGSPLAGADKALAGME
jgi:hypothetical protein